MSQASKRFAVITGASSGIGTNYADRPAKRGRDPAPGFVERGGSGGGGTNINIASIVALAPEILDGIYGGLEAGPPSLERRREKTDLAPDMTADNAKPTGRQK
jgi:hypothetical protein